MPSSTHRVSSGRWVTLVTVLSIIGLAVGSGSALFESISSAAPTRHQTGNADVPPAVSRVHDPKIPALQPLDTGGKRIVQLSAARPPGPVGSVPQPSRAHLAGGELPREADQNATFTTNWSGQILSGGSFTGVGGQWTVPAVVPTTSAEYSATWLGIDGVSTSSLIQTGTSQDTVGGVDTYFAWVELLPGAPLEISSAPVAPGDVMQATIAETSVDTWGIDLQDVTANWAYTGSFSYSTPGLSAEWIEEAPTVGATQSTLADFGSTPFANLQAAVSSGASPTLDPVYMFNPTGIAIIAYPGVFNSVTSSFTDFFGSPPPVVTSVAPNDGDVSGGSVVTVFGDFLFDVQTVAFGSSDTSFSPNGDGTIAATSPPDVPGTVDIAVTTAGGTSIPSAADQFTYFVPAPPHPAPPPSTPQHGYWLVGGDGGIFTFGSAQFYGSTGSLRLQRPVVGITPTGTDAGYWLVASDGGIFAFGNAGYFGSIPGLGYLPAGTPGRLPRLNAPVVAMVPTTDGGGYFMVASDGGVFAFGDARFEGSCPGIGGCSGSGVAVMPDASGNGYWLVTASGHVYTFGDAAYYGAPGPVGTVTSAVRTPDGNGYWILMSNGSVAAYGDATSYGQLPGGQATGANPATAIFSTADGFGYWIGTANGSVYSFGDAQYEGGLGANRLNAPIIAAVGW